MRRDEIRDLTLILCMKGMLYHSLLCVIYNTVYEKTLNQNLQLLIIWVPLFLFAFFRRKCRKFLTFLLFHAVTIIIFLFIFPDLEERIAVGGCTIYMAAVSIHLRLRGGQEEDCPPVSSLILFFIMYLAASQNNRLYTMQICCYELILFLILFMAYKSLASTTIFLRSNEAMENLPVKQIKNMSRMLLGIFILFFAAAMLLMPYLPADSLFHAVGQLLRFLLVGILKFILRIFEKDTPKMEFFEEHTEGMMPSLEAGETSMFVKLLEKFFITAVYVLIIIGAVYLLVKVFYEWYRKFYETDRSATDESEFLWENPIVKMQAGTKKVKENFKGRSINQKIRRLYKKNIKRQFYKKQNVPIALTPTELEAFMKESKADNKCKADDTEWKEYKLNTEQKITLYEKARYSQYECGKQELEAMKRVSK